MKVVFWNDERIENWAKYQCKSCDPGLYLISSSSVRYVGDFFLLLFSTRHNRSSVLQSLTWPLVILNTHIAIQMIKAGSLRHYTASLLQLYYVCRGPLKHSIFIYNVGLFTYTQIPSKCVCVGVLWQLKKTFQVFLACWGHRGQPLWRAGSLYICSTSHGTTSNKHSLLL